MTKAEQAVLTMMSGMNCAQSVASVFARDLGVDEVQLQRSLSCFGSGLNVGEACGALTGGLAVLGLYGGYAAPDETDAKAAAKAVAAEMAERFRKEYGTLLCRDIKAAGEGKTYERTIDGRLMELNICRRAVYDAVGMVEILLSEWQTKR